MAQCTAKSKSTGGRCTQRAMAGGNVCYWHGGAAPQTKARAAKRVSEAAVRAVVDKLGIPVETTPEEALLSQVWEAAGNVELLRSMVQSLASQTGIEIDPLTQEIRAGLAHLTGSAHKRFEAAPHVLVRMYNEERDRLVRFATAAAEIGIEDRVISLAERQGELLARIIETALADEEWGLSDANRERGRQVFSRTLRLVGGDG